MCAGGFAAGCCCVVTKDCKLDRTKAPRAAEASGRAISGAWVPLGSMYVALAASILLAVEHVTGELSDNAVAVNNVAPGFTATVTAGAVSSALTVIVAGLTASAATTSF